MMGVSQILLSLLLLTIIFALNSSRLRVLVFVMLFQGILISILPLAMEDQLQFSSIFFIITTFIIKGGIIPLLLYITLKKVIQKKEMEPIIGYIQSMLIALVIIIVSEIITRSIVFPVQVKLLAITSFSMIMTGMFLLVARRKTFTQIIGYLMMENGIYLTGLTLVHKSMDIIEFGILLDVLVGIMIMVFVLTQINATFSNINTKNLKNLRE